MASSLDRSVHTYRVSNTSHRPASTRIRVGTGLELRISVTSVCAAHAIH